MRTVQVYIEGQKLELFNDEQINVTSSQQNVQDISKVFTDFSQSFSVPATPSNNAIFQHFYQNDVQSTIDHNIRRNGYIEIDLTTFRRGKIQLEKSVVKDNEAYSYQITFYGDITSLKDKFGEDKLFDLDSLGIFKHPYSAAEVKDRIIDGTTNYVIRYPLIASRYLQYDNPALPDDDINTDTGAIKYTELFPAIRIAAIFGAMQVRYGVTFEGTFLTDKRFQNCFLYCKNALDFEFLTDTLPVDLDIGGQFSVKDFASIPSPQVYTDYFDISAGTISYGHVPFSTVVPSVPSSATPTSFNHKVFIITTNVSIITAIYYIDVVLNGIVVMTYQSSQFGGNIIATQISDDLNTVDLESQVYQFRVRADQQIDVEITIYYDQVWYYIDGGVQHQGYNRYYAENTTPTAITGDISVLPYLPDMKVSDWFSGILKEFNLTCYGLEENKFQVEPLDDWYLKGAIVNITEYTDIESIEISRIKLFRLISFEYQQSENILNAQFRELFNRGYGNTKSEFAYDGGEYKIKQPFENMHMNKFTNTDLQVGFTVNQDLEKYVPKPMLLYMYEETPATFRYFNGVTTETLTEYMPFGQDVQVNSTNYTLNFAPEVSTLTNITNLNTLFAVYYAPYLLNLFKLKNRRTTLKTNLPVSLLTGLRLNDRVIIRDKRYIIESMKSNLNSGDVDLVLINDFRPLIADGNAIIPIEPINPGPESGCLEVRILFPNGAIQADITTTDIGVTITPNVLYADGWVEICLPENPQTTTVLKTEDDLDYINTEDLADRIRTEEGQIYIYTILVTYTYQNGTQVANQIFIEQQP